MCADSCQRVNLQDLAQSNEKVKEEAQTADKEALNNSTALPSSLGMYRLCMQRFTVHLRAQISFLKALSQTLVL